MEQEPIGVTLLDKLGIQASHLDALRHSLKDDLTPVIVIIQEWRNEILQSLDSVLDNEVLDHQTKVTELQSLIVRTEGEDPLTPRITNFCFNNTEYFIAIAEKMREKLSMILGREIDFSSAHVLLGTLIQDIGQHHTRRMIWRILRKQDAIQKEIDEKEQVHRYTVQLEQQLSLRRMRVQAQKGAEALKTIAVALAGAQKSFKTVEDGMDNFLHSSQEIQQFSIPIIQIADSLNQAARVALKETQVVLQESLFEC